MVDQLFIELNKEYRLERLREAEKERMLMQVKKDKAISLRAKFFTNLGNLLVTSGLKLRSVAQSRV